MNVSLDPVVSLRLRQFARRRFALILARGLCAGLVTFVLCVALGALIDWYWLLSDGQRWAVTALVYLPAAVVLWMVAGRHLLRSPKWAEIAVQVEQLQPELRDQLLSAVELAADDGVPTHDSPAFRALLQDHVAQRLGPIPVSGLLPVRLIVRWGFAAVIVTAAAALLMSSPDTRFRQLAVRALLPTSNVARVSRIHVRILQPTPASLVLAEDETVAVVVEISGGDVQEVILETESSRPGAATQGAARQPMRRDSAGQFVATVHVTEGSVDYRIRAGDALTERFTLQARPRPRVVAFTKTYDFPQYSLLPDRTLTEPHGDLTALQDTQVLLNLQLDQPVSVAELHIDGVAESKQVIPLAPHLPDGSSGGNGAADGLQWQAMIPVSEASIYRVHLVAEETGFENTFSPKYEIRPQPDLMPRTGFLNQQETTLLLPPNEIIGLQAMAEDDLPLVSLAQHVSINGDDWREFPLTMQPVPGTLDLQVTAAWQWDLMPLQLKTGDQVVTRLVATDRKGNSGESIPLRIVVADPQFQPQRHTLMERRLSLIPELAAFAALTGEHKLAALEIIQRLQLPPAEAGQTARDHSALRDMAFKQQEQATALLIRIQEILPDMPAGADAYELDLAGRVIASAGHDHARVTGAVLNGLQQTISAELHKNDLAEIQRAFERAADDTQNLAVHFQNICVHSFLNAVASDLDALLQHQQRVVNHPGQQWQRLVRQETVAVNQLQQLEQLVQLQQKNLPDFMQGHLKNLLTWSETMRDRLKFVMESEDQLPQLQSVTREFLNQLEQRQRMDVVDGGVPGRLVTAWRDLDHRSGLLSLHIEHLAQVVQQEDRVVQQALTAPDSAAVQDLQNQAARLAAHIDFKFRSRVNQLGLRRQLTQARSDADNDAASDAGLTLRAVTSLLNQHSTVLPAESKIASSLLQVAPAFRTLEAGHQLIAARNLLYTLLEKERWNLDQLSAHMDHPRQWDLLQRLLELASQRLREARVDQQLVTPLDQLRNAAAYQNAQRKITERRWKRDALVSSAHDLAELADDLDVLVADLQPAMTAARDVIRQFTPAISQMAEQAAVQVRQLEEQTLSVADEREISEASSASASPDDAAATTATALAALQQQQQSINLQIDDLLQALVEDANRQNTVHAEERERARDADDSIASVQHSATQMNRELQQALQIASEKEQAVQLTRAAEQQEKAAQTLDLVAEHFQRLDEQEDVAESRAALRDLEQQYVLQAEMDQRYKDSAELEERLTATPAELLEKLEAELQQNPEMQQALSEISRQSLREAHSALQYAAADEQNLQRSNERSDASFHERKREQVEELREMGVEASRLSSMLLANASQAAAQGKAPEAQELIAQTQNRLNAAAARASDARDEMLLADLAQTTADVHAAFAEATDLLHQTEAKTRAASDQAIHADEKTREAQQKDMERRRQQFHDQQKRTANDLAKRADDTRRRAEQTLRSAENELKNSVKKVEQTRTQLARKPEDNGLQRTLSQEQSRQAAFQQKTDLAAKRLQQADHDAQHARERASRIADKPRPPLTAPNPAAELARHYAAESLQDAQSLQQRAEELAAAMNFGSELRPAENQLTTAGQKQTRVTTDIQHAADDIARAARHELRLDHRSVAEPLQTAARQIEAVAHEESARAEQQLERAATEAQQSEAERAAQTEAAVAAASAAATGEAQSAESAQGAAAAADQPQRSQALKAQQELAASEAAIAKQSGLLNEMLTPLLATGEANGEPTDEPTGEGAPEADGEAAGEAISGVAESGSSSAADASPASGRSEAAGSRMDDAALQERRTQATQLARTLDELDRLLASGAAATADSSEPAQSEGEPPAAALNSLSQAARARQAALAAARQPAGLQSRNPDALAAARSLDEAGTFSGTGALPPGDNFEVAPVNRSENADWGRLRRQTADNVTQGQSEKIAEEYRDSVETYFRVLAERARVKP